MNKLFKIYFFLIFVFINSCGQNLDHVSSKESAAFSLLGVEISNLKNNNDGASSNIKFELQGVTYYALGNAVTESFVGNKLVANWANATFMRSATTGQYYSIIPEYNNSENYFYVVRGLVNYSTAGCPIGETYSTATNSCSKTKDSYGGPLVQDWTKTEYYRYRYTDDQANGKFYLCVEAGPYDSLDKVKADTTVSVFDYSKKDQEITNSSTCKDQDGSNSGSSNIATGRVRQNIFDGFWFELTKVK